MPAYEPNLPARQVHARFTRTLEEAESVRKNLVLWFADLYRRKLYLELGYTSVYAYTAERHGFSRSRCTQFIRLAESLSKLPALRDALAAGEMPWTKAREVVKVATPRTERAWVAEARRSSRRVLERKVVEARERAATDRSAARGQGRLALAAGSGESAGMRAGGSMKESRDTKVGRDAKRSRNTEDGRDTEDARGTDEREAMGGRDSDDRSGGVSHGSTSGLDSGVPAALVREIPEEVRLRFSALRYAEYGALVEKLRKLGWREPMEDLIVAGLAALAAEGRVPAGQVTAPDAASNPAPNSSRGKPGKEGQPTGTREWTEVRTRVATPKQPGAATAPPGARTRVFTDTPYQVVIRRCEACGKGAVVTGRGPRPLPAAELQAILCDAGIHRHGERNRAAIPPARRREVLERDGHRCRVPGCGSAHFLSVHHVEPRSSGGSNTPGNLVTLCASCHRAVHDMAERAGRGFLQQLFPDSSEGAGGRRRMA